MRAQRAERDREARRSRGRHRFRATNRRPRSLASGRASDRSRRSHVLPRNRAHPSGSKQPKRAGSVARANVRRGISTSGRKSSARRHSAASPACTQERVPVTGSGGSKAIEVTVCAGGSSVRQRGRRRGRVNSLVVRWFGLCPTYRSASIPFASTAQRLGVEPPSSSSLPLTTQIQKATRSTSGSRSLIAGLPKAVQWPLAGGWGLFTDSLQKAVGNRRSAARTPRSRGLGSK